MSGDWRAHLEEVEELRNHGAEAVENYFSESKYLMFQRYEEESEKTGSGNFTDERLWNMENEGIVDCVDEKIVERSKAEEYAEVYRKMFDLMKDNYEEPEPYVEEMKELKQERDKTERKIDGREGLDVPDNFVVEIIEQELDSILQESKHCGAAPSP